MQPSGTRYAPLDSLRGLAALSVVFHHCLLILPAIFDTPYPGGVWIWQYTPLHVMWAGRQAVMFFFVLSGFVLALPFYRRNVGYLAFVIKRVCRIYPAYLVALVVAVVASTLLARHGVSGLSTWFNRQWVTPVTPEVLGAHALLVGTFNPEAFNPVLWSLIQEMRVSLVFPLLMIGVRRLPWWFAVGLCIPLSFLGSIAQDPVGVASTGEYLLMFVLGAVAAKHLAALRNACQRLPFSGRWILIVIALLAYTYPHWFIPDAPVLHPKALDDWAAAFGACTFIVMVMASPGAARVLAVRPLPLLGRISYSLYLYSAVTLLALVSLLYTRLPLPVIWGLALATTLLMAWISYRVIEVPGIRFGHLIEAWLSRGRVEGERGRWAA